MKNEIFYGHEDEFNSLEDLQKAIIEYIDYYNNKRISLKRKGLSPIKSHIGIYWTINKKEVRRHCLDGVLANLYNYFVIKF